MADDFELSIKSNIDEFARDLDDQMRSQMPFAVSRALNKLSRMVVEGEKKNIKEVFPTATPFTQNAMAYIPSTKNRLESVVFVKDIQEKYLEPYEFEGSEIPAGPGNVAMLRPIGIGVNKYGNIPYKKIANLKAKKNVFSGTIKTKSGQTVSGVFQRMSGKNGGPRLKILVRFADPHQVHEELHYFDRAQEIVLKNFEQVMSESLGQALATMK